MAGTTEEFVLVDNGKLTAEYIREEIVRLKAVYAKFENSKDDLKMAQSDAEKDTQDFKDQSSKLAKIIMDKKQEHIKLECTWQSNLFQSKTELDTLLEKRQEVDRQLKEEERKRLEVDEKVKISSERPERKVVFKGALCDVPSKDDGISVEPRICYPLSGGTALITFEKEEFAQKVLAIKEHKICIDECFVRVTASAVELPMPSSIAVDMRVCNCAILVSNIPGCISQERLLDKLEILFSKKKNGGGEVDCCEFLHDSGHVIITFTEDGVAKRLTSKGWVKFTLDSKTYDLKVTPYVKGDIKDVKFRDSICCKTVQLTGIPDIMERGALQDVLEIHFAKGSNGGGELEVVAYVPVGKSAIAIFEEDTE